MPDRPAIHGAEGFVNVGYPLNAEALLIIELDGPPAEIEELTGRVEQIAEDHHATEIRPSRTEAERLAFWSGRKAAFPAARPLSPHLYFMYSTFPPPPLTHVPTPD